MQEEKKQEELSYEEIAKQLALLEETSVEEHQYIDEEVELVDENASGISAKLAFSVPGVTFKDVRHSLAKIGTYYKRTMASIRNIVIHHSGTVTGSAEAYANYHTGTHKWPGIGYHIVIEQDGTVKYCNDLDRISYHAGNANSYSVGICMTGDFSVNKPTMKQWQALYKTIVAVQALTPSARGVLAVIGHQECPGYASKQCPSLDMDAIRGELQSKRYGQVANKYKNDQKILVKNGSTGAVETTPTPSKPSTPTTPSYKIESGRIGTVTIVADELNLRKLCDVTSPVVKVLKKGEVYKCYGECGWGFNLGSGFVAKDPKYTSFSSHVGVAEILVDSLNVRQDASFAAAIVKENGQYKTLKQGTKWKVYESRNGLLRVGANQWISAGEKYVRLTSS